MKINRILAFALSLAVSFGILAAKDNYRLTIKINGAQDTMLLLGYYYAKGTYAMDTAYSHDGQFTFKSESKEMLPGLYFFSNKSGKYVEFVVYNERPFFDFETDEADWMKNMQVKGSEENKKFYEFHHLRDQIDQTYPIPDGVDSSAYVSIRRQQEKVMDSLRNDFIAKNPKRMISKMMLATKNVEVPEFDPLGVQYSPMWRWRYYVSHFFDNMPLDDDFFVRTPRAVFYDPIMNYFDQGFANAPPDTIIPYLDAMLNKAKPSKENFHYLLHTLTEKYLQSNIMVYDAIYVHLVKEFYAKGDAWWMSVNDIETEVDRAERWDKLLVGRIAPELVLWDAKGKPHSLHAQPHQFTLLIFWSPSCGHCQHTIPEVYKKFAAMRSKYDIGGYAILTEFDDDNVVKWENFIKEHHLDWINLNGREANVDWHDVYDVTSTPQIYLLDKDKTILAKKIDADTFEQVMKAIAQERGL